MGAQVTYFFSFLSPWAYIGHDYFHKELGKAGVEILYRPINVPGAFDASGTPALGKRHPTRQNYRTVELQRWRDKRGLEFNLWPDHWPFPAATGDRMIIAIVEADGDPSAFMRIVFKGVWEEGKNLGDEAELIHAADAAGLDGERVLKQANLDETGAIYERNTKDAVETGVFGVPAYIYQGEYFWGQDRIDLLVDAINSGRGGYKPVMPG